MSLSPSILQHARELRARLTDAEKLLWSLLRDRRFYGYKFRRQHPVGGYILDFYCQEAGLAIELDGSSHNKTDQMAYDAERVKELSGAGIRVLRFWNSEALVDTESVLEEIYSALLLSASSSDPTSPPSPSSGLRPPSPPGRRRGG